VRQEHDDTLPHFPANFLMSWHGIWARWRGGAGGRLEDPAEVADVPGLDVLRYSEPLTPAMLQPFIEKMRHGGANAGN